MIENLIKWVPYNEFIGKTNCTDTHLVEVIEEWKDVLNYEGVYKISSFGRVLSVERRTPGGTSVTEKLLSVKDNSWGYLSVCLNYPKMTTKQLHILVAEVFISNPHNKPLVNHWNGNKKDPIFFNLRWSTHSENTKHSYNIGTQVSIMHADQCKIIFDTYTGIFYGSIRELSREMGIPHSTISSSIKRGYNKRHIFV